MNKWRLLLFAVFCIFQPISTENLFDGRERCLQRPDIYRKGSRLLEYKSNARSEIRGENRNGREDSERVNSEYGLRFSERNFNNHDENVRSEDRRSRSNDRIRVSPTRQLFAENVNENRISERSSKNERREPELRNAREERRLNTERERNIRLTRNLPQDRQNEREETRARNTVSRDSQFVYAPSRRTIERHFDDTQERLIHSRQSRYFNERKESRSSLGHPLNEVRGFLRRDDSNRNNERRNLPENRRQNAGLEHIIRDVNKISQQRAPATTRRVTEQRRSVQRRESDESLTFRRESRKSSDEASERIVRLDTLNLRRQINEPFKRAQRNVPATRRNNIKLERENRAFTEEINRRSSPTTVVFERIELAQRRETDKPRRIIRELRSSSDRAYERESVQKREYEESRDIRRGLRDSAEKGNRRVIRSENTIRRTTERDAQAQRNIRSEFERTYNDEISRRDEAVRNSKDKNNYFRRDTRNSDRSDARIESEALRNIYNVRQNSRIDLTRTYNDEINRRSSNDRIEYLQRRNSDTSRDFRRETRAQRSEDYIDRALSSDRKTLPKISEQRKFVERSDRRQFQRENRNNADIRFLRTQRINRRLQTHNRRERENYVGNTGSVAAIARDVLDKRTSILRDNLNELRNFRPEIKAIRIDDSRRRENERLNTRDQRDVLQSRRRDLNIHGPHVDLRQDNRLVDENRRTTRDVTKRDNGLTRVVRDGIEGSRYNIRDNERTKERSLERTVSMLVRKQLENRIKRDYTSRRTRISDSNVLRSTFDQRTRTISQNNREDEKNVNRRINRNTPHESLYMKNTFGHNMERDSGKRRLDDSNSNRRDSRDALSSSDKRNSAKNVRGNRNIREEVRLSMAPHDDSSKEVSEPSFKWQHLLYLLQAVYIIGLFAKLPQAKENLEKKTRIGIWNHSPKFIKVD